MRNLINHSKLTGLLFFLFIFVGNTAWASNKDYYSKATVNVSSSGGGKVYVKYNNSTEPGDGDYNNESLSAESGKDSKSSAPNHTYHLWAKANAGFKFKNWTGGTVTKADASYTTASITANTDVSKATKTYTANFVQVWNYYSRLTVNTDGPGKVLVSTETKVSPSVTATSSFADKNVLETENQGAPDVTYYIYVKPDDAFNEFKGFEGISPESDSEKGCYTLTVKANSENSAAPTTYIGTAVFGPKDASEGLDVTSLIVNPSYEESPWNKGWAGTGEDKFQAFAKVTGVITNVSAEMWNPEVSSGSISQTISNLPAGTYVLGAAVIKGTDGLVSIKATTSTGNEFTTVIPWMPEDPVQHPALEFTLEETTDVTISFNRENCVWWTAVDDWTLTYYGVVEEEDQPATDEVDGHVHYYKYGSASDVLVVELTEDVPVVDVTGSKATINVTATNPNGLVYAKAGQTVNGITNNIVVDGTCANLTLVNGHSFHAHKNFTATSATYNMNAVGQFASGTYGTLMLPFAVTNIPSDGKAYSLDKGVTPGDYINATETSIAANSPMLVTKSGTYSASSVPVAPTADSYENGELIGRYMPAEVPEGAYVMQNHSSRVAFYLVGNGTQTPTKPTAVPFRAYIKSQDSNVRAMYILFPEDEATGIDETVNKRETATSRIYDLSGRQVKNTQRGIYIINGKKVLR